ncbi:MAG: thiamine pyrophosphate-dependent enzyme, partial [Rhodospirillales bacterium]|nr:thiamine pyrophosphate-dependent enzyme [Rhodospirillales bacterium]
QGRVSVAFFGDGALQQGILYESLNLAALWSLPVLFVAINNQYGMGTRIDRATANTAFDERARAFGLEAAILDGLDVEDVFIAAEKLVEGARAGKPAFISLECYRFHGHARKDKSPYRSEGEESEGRGKDSVLFARRKLLDMGKATEKSLDALDAKIEAEMDTAVDFALAADMPDDDLMFEHVYSAGSPRPRPVRERLAAALSEDLS